MITIFAKDGTSLLISYSGGKPNQGGQHVTCSYLWFFFEDDWHMCPERSSYKAKIMIESADTVMDVINLWKG